MGAARLPRKSPLSTRWETTPPHSFVYCHDRFFVGLVALIGDVRASLVSNKEKAVAENAVTPEKRCSEYSLVILQDYVPLIIVTICISLWSQQQCGSINLCNYFILYIFLVFFLRRMGKTKA